MDHCTRGTRASADERDMVRNCERPAADQCDCAIHVMLRFVRSSSAYVNNVLTGLVCVDPKDLVVTVERSADNRSIDPTGHRCSMAAGDRHGSGRCSKTVADECARRRPSADHRRSVKDENVDPARVIDALCDRMSDILSGVWAAVESREPLLDRQSMCSCCEPRPTANTCERASVGCPARPSDHRCCCCCCCCGAAAVHAP